jgi:NADH:ubiquinone oxidoreductase subunit 5 (subunit L)/multisubunit Na+/H+ antiporter MnhA subunit
VILTVLSFSTYCDCPYIPYLDLKLCLFYSAVNCVALFNHLPVLLTTFEIVGLCSFRLIWHYLHRSSAARGSTIALTSNRFSDLLLLTVTLPMCSLPMVSLAPMLLMLTASIKSVSVYSFL